MTQKDYRMTRPSQQREKTLPRAARGQDTAGKRSEAQTLVARF